MFLPTHKRTLLLAGFAAGVFVASLMVNRPDGSTGKTASASSGELPRINVTPVVAVKLVEPASASVSKRVKNVSVATSVGKILPRLEQNVADWRGYQPRKMMIAPYADLALEFEMTSVRQENGRTIWRGRNALSGAFLVTVATQNEWHAVLEIPAASSFEFHISGQAATVTETDPLVLCGNDKLVAAAAVAGVTDAVATQVAAATNTDGAEGAANTVDVLFFYDAATLEANHHNTQRIETTIAGLVESANSVLQNSGVDNLRWNFVAAYPVPTYAATSNLQDDLNQMSNTSNAVGKLVAEKCALHGVDQAVLFVASQRGDNFDGLAWIPSSQTGVAHNSAVVWNSGYVVLAHELAHNFGCRHDRQTEGAPTGDGKYGYGFRFDLNGEDTGTVMSYASTRVPFFSNPNRMYAGVHLGSAADSAVPANNSLVLSEHAQVMAASREAEQKPIITTHPQSTNASRGAEISLFVSATGSALNYQWKKNGVDLPGATTAGFVKANAVGADDGVYNVVVSNSLGQVSSENATVAVAETAAASTSAVSGSSSSAAAGSGGGGGGGAVSPWVLVAFAALGSLRLIGRVKP